MGVALTVDGGEGGYSANGGGNSGNGASVVLTNAIDGVTTGDLALRQTAYGGSAGQVATTSGGNGLAGDASSVLTKSGSFASLGVTTEATGGGGSIRLAERRAIGWR